MTNPIRLARRTQMGMLAKIFTWWNGATLGTSLMTARRGAKVGADALGNVYYQGGIGINNQPRRWVIYNGPNDASRVPPDWHGWLHGTLDQPPDQSLPAPRAWEKPALGNTTGSRDAYRPAGALESGGKRAVASGDYEAWVP
jgi:NADH:ubiquinone oxidoreductase subunit